MFTFTLKDNWIETIAGSGKRKRMDCFAGPATAKAQINAINRLILAAEVIEETEDATTYRMETK